MTDMTGALVRRLRGLVLAGLVLAITGCGDSATLEPLPAGGTILAFGDSLTYGTGAREEESYPQVLAGLTGHPVVNAGVPGEVSAEGLRRLPALLEETRPSLVILCHGGNDILRKRSKSKAAANLGEMIRLAREAGAQVILLGVPGFGLILDTEPFYLEVAKAQSVPIEAEVIPDVLSDNNLKSDAVHPNAAGYARMAEAVREFLQDQGAL